MIARILNWWRTRQVIKLGKVEVEKFNHELSECRTILASIADEQISGLGRYLGSLKSDSAFGLDLVRDAWRDWHQEGEELIEISREATHKRMSPHLEFAKALEIEGEMNGVIDNAVDEFKAYFLLGGANVYMNFATDEGLVPDDCDTTQPSD